MKKPLIALMPSREQYQILVSQHYFDALWEAGATGVIVAYTTDPERLREYSEYFDGFLYCGGVDIDPKYYGEEKINDSVNICAERDEFESALFPIIYETKKPILGICRGIQVMNVFMGGTLYQHMDGHMQQIDGFNTSQNVTVNEGTLMHKITGETSLITNTFHHQNVKDLGRGIVADAVSEDGFVEAIHDENHPFFLGIQWHPEMYRTKDVAMQKVFKAFVDACK